MTIAALLRTIAILLVALLAPARMMARVRGFNAVQLWLFARNLEDMRAHGEALRYPGESLATVARRIDLLAWIAADVHGAHRHLARRARGWRRARMMRSAPLSFAPPVLPAPSLADACVAPVLADTS